MKSLKEIVLLGLSLCAISCSTNSSRASEEDSWVEVYVYDESGSIIYQSKNGYCPVYSFVHDGDYFYTNYKGERRTSYYIHKARGQQEIVYTFESLIGSVKYDIKYYFHPTGSLLKEVTTYSINNSEWFLEGDPNKAYAICSSQNFYPKYLADYNDCEANDIYLNERQTGNKTIRYINANINNTIIVPIK